MEGNPDSPPCVLDTGEPSLCSPCRYDGCVNSIDPVAMKVRITSLGGMLSVGCRMAIHRLNEVKVIFLGEGAAGKTSLIKRLRGEGFDPEESQTHGIRIQKTPFNFDGETITAHCWDFGGQEVNHATHQFFLSQRCIYVAVLNSRSDDKAEKWLKHAASFGGRSPVLVVLNKIDENPSFQVNQKLLSEKYPNILGFHRLSCGTGQGVEEFRLALTSQIEQADARRTPFPAAWLVLRPALI